jgi:uncharacterized protein (TIGR03084 family)
VEGALMPVEFQQLLADLREESQVVDGLIAGLGPEAWRTPTPAQGWSVGDQVSHLAYFDDAAVRAATDPGQFEVDARALMAQGPDFPDDVADLYRSLTPTELLDWFRAARHRLLEVFALLEPRARLPWYGPSMSAASAATARLMETWAHGQDIADAVGADYPATLRLRHIAHLGVRTFGFSFELQDLKTPTEEVRVSLIAPDGTTWDWGDPNATESVSGPALDFCLVVTQRRHPDDSGLVATGPVGTRWLSLAQAYAGPPGPGRAPEGGCQQTALMTRDAQET